MRLVFVGPPGAGKGTQAASLAAREQIAHISTGDMLREAVREGTPAGRKARPIMDAGGLVPDEVVLEMVAERIEKDDAKGGFILDGYPRNPKQASDLDALLAERGLGLDAVVCFELDDEEVVQRLAGRRVCPACGAVYHVRSGPPREEGRCDKEQAELEQRPDDREEVIRARLATYRDKTAPLIGYYRDKGLLRSVPAAGGVEEVQRGLAEALRQRSGQAE